MLSIRGIYDGKEIKLLQPIPTKKNVNVIITLLDDDFPDKKTIEKKYKNYYQKLTPEECEEEASLAGEFQPLDFETNQVLEDQEV